jgi:hypothetical protein
MRSGERVVVEDVTTSEIFAGQPSMNVLVCAGVRYLRALNCPQVTVKRLNDGEPVVLRRQAGELHLVPQAVGRNGDGV